MYSIQYLNLKYFLWYISVNKPTDHLIVSYACSWTPEHQRRYKRVAELLGVRKLTVVGESGNWASGNLTLITKHNASTVLRRFTVMQGLQLLNLLQK